MRLQSVILHIQVLFCKEYFQKDHKKLVTKVKRINLEIWVKKKMALSLHTLLYCINLFFTLVRYYFFNYKAIYRVVLENGESPENICNPIFPLSFCHQP